MKDKEWTQEKDGIISIPDELDPLFNKIGIQMRFMNISGKNEVQTIVDIMAIAQDFFKNNPELLNL